MAEQLDEDLLKELKSSVAEVNKLRESVEDLKDARARLIYTIRTLNGQIDGLTKINEELRLSVDVLTRAKKKEDLTEQEDKPRKLDL